MSDECADLAVSLQREDLRAIHDDLEQATDQLATDCEMAIQLYEIELSAWEGMNADRNMARSLAQAVLEDTRIVHDMLVEEQRAAEDRRLACELGGINASDEPKIIETARDDLGPKSLARYVSFNVPEVDLSECLENLAVDEYNVEEGESSKSARWKGKGKERAGPLEKIVCIVCSETKHFFDILQIPCGHNYCRTCIVQLFSLAITDESLFPPRCCRMEIQLDLADQFLNKEFSARFAKKAEELRTPNRTYCFAPSCSRFIPPADIYNDIATCSVCLERTCTVCKGAAHDGDCPYDTALQQVIEAANENGWQRCYSCKRLVELAHGCNHMRYDQHSALLGSTKLHISCLCKAQFCYVCAQSWKTCDCPTWTEHRLYNRAVQVAAREPQHLIDDIVPVQGIGAGPADAPLEELDDAPIDEIQLPIPIPHAGEFDVPPEQDPVIRVHSPDLPEPNPGQAVIIRQIMDDLRENHVCTHKKWNFIPGPHQCEECFHMLPRFIFECRQCYIRACWRCRHNRL